MKFSRVSSLAGLLAVASANYPAVPEPEYPQYYHTQWEKVVCTDPAPYTYTKTETVTEYYSTYAPEPTYITEPPYEATTYVVTEGPTVTSVDYYGDMTTVWVYPTGTGSHDCDVAIYKDNYIVNVVIVNIEVTYNNYGAPITVTKTVWDKQPTYTPPPVTYTVTDTYTPIYTSVYTPWSSGYNPSSTYTDTVIPPFPTDSTSSYTVYPTGYTGTGGQYTKGYPAPTYYPPSHPRRWVA